MAFPFTDFSCGCFRMKKCCIKSQFLALLSTCKDGIYPIHQTVDFSVAIGMVLLKPLPTLQSTTVVMLLMASNKLVIIFTVCVIHCKCYVWIAVCEEVVPWNCWFCLILRLLCISRAYFDSVLFFKFNVVHLFVFFCFLRVLLYEVHYKKINK